MCVWVCVCVGVCVGVRASCSRWVWPPAGKLHWRKKYPAVSVEERRMRKEDWRENGGWIKEKKGEKEKGWVRREREF